MSKPIELIIVDVDGTIADIRPRLKHAGHCPDRKDRKAFQAWLDTLQNEKTLAKDAPLNQVIALIKSIAFQLADAPKVVYLTGRSEKYRAVTEQWLYKHKLPFGPVLMRGLDDWRPAAEYKGEVMQRLLSGVNPERVVVFDDDYDGDCSVMYTRLGCIHLKVCCE